MTEIAAAARYVLRAARARDRDEIEAAIGYDAALANLDHWLGAALIVRVFAHDNAPAAFVAVHYKTARAVEMSMVATSSWPRVARSVTKWAKREALPALLEMGYARAECRMLDGHQDAQAFLDWLGFTLECRCPEYGAGGETFLQFAWRRQDHVLCPENPGPAGGAAA